MTKQQMKKCGCIKNLPNPNIHTATRGGRGMRLQWRPLRLNVSRRLPSLWFNISASGWRRTNHAASATTRTTTTTTATMNKSNNIHSRDSRDDSRSVWPPSYVRCRCDTIGRRGPPSAGGQAVRRATAYNRKLCEVRCRFGRLVRLLGFFLCFCFAHSIRLFVAT